MTAVPSSTPNKAPKPDHRRLPRKKRQPSQRDQALFNLRQAKGWTQERIAKEQRLSQSRVSQILRRVADWRETQQPAGGAELAGEEERQERRLERARHQEMYERSLREFDSVPPEWTSVRRIHRGQAVVRETTTREQSPSVQWLKVAQRASEALTWAAATPPAAEEASQLLEHAEQLRQMTSVLAALCSEADAAAQRLNLLEAVLAAAASNSSILTPPESSQVAAESQLGEELSAKSVSEGRCQTVDRRK